MHAWVSGWELITRLCCIIMEKESEHPQRMGSICDPEPIVQTNPKTWSRDERRQLKQVPKSNPEPQPAQISSRNEGDRGTLYWPLCSILSWLLWRWVKKVAPAGLDSACTCYACQGPCHWRGHCKVTQVTTRAIVLLSSEALVYQLLFKSLFKEFVINPFIAGAILKY